MPETASKVGEGNEVLSMIFDPSTARQFITNVELAIRTKESGGLGKSGDFFVSVMGSEVSIT